jgi:hypothetical protein
MNRKTNLRTRKTRKQSQRKYFLTGGEEKRHAIMSYNMSWVSDLGTPTNQIPDSVTESHFLSSARALKGIGEHVKSREFWQNAFRLVKQFIANEPDFTAIGIQELNDPEYIRQRDPSYKEGGLDEIKEFLKCEHTHYTKGKDKLRLAYDGVEVKINNNFIKPTLAILWDSKKLGEMSDMYCNELYYNNPDKPPILPPPPQGPPPPPPPARRAPFRENDPRVVFLRDQRLNNQRLTNNMIRNLLSDNPTIQQLRNMFNPQPPPAPALRDERETFLRDQGLNNNIIRNLLSTNPTIQQLRNMFNRQAPPAPVAHAPVVAADPRFQQVLSMGFSEDNIRRGIAATPGETLEALIDYILNHQQGGELNNALYDNNEYKGRPILIVLTTGGYILINLHAPNYRDATQEKIKQTIEQIQLHLVFAMSKFDIDMLDMNKVFIMGDFNDQENIIKNISLNNEVFTYGEGGVKSCCAYGTNISKYESKGDYVFGKNLVKPLAIYRENLNQISFESDHEPVYAIFKEDVPVVANKSTNIMRKQERNVPIGSELYGNGTIDHNGIVLTSNDGLSLASYKDPATRNEVIRLLGGMTFARLHSKKNNHSNKWVVKDGGDKGWDLVRDEYQAGLIYAATGIKVPKQRIDSEKRILISQYLPGTLIGTLKTRNRKEFEEAKRQARAGFAVDVLLGNYDVYGSDEGNNMMFYNRLLYRIDNGCSFDRSPGGNPKEKMKFTEDAASQIDWLRTLRADTRGAEKGTIELYKDIPYREVADQIRQLIIPNAKTIIALTPDRIDIETTSRSLKTIMKERIDSMTRWAEGK